MIILTDAEANSDTVINPDTIKWVRLVPNLGTRITFIDNTYVIVRETVQTCIEKIAKKPAK